MFSVRVNLSYHCYFYNCSCIYFVWVLVINCAVLSKSVLAIFADLPQFLFAWKNEKFLKKIFKNWNLIVISAMLRVGVNLRRLNEFEGEIDSLGLPTWFPVGHSFLSVPWPRTLFKTGVLSMVARVLCRMLDSLSP